MNYGCAIGISNIRDPWGQLAPRFKAEVTPLSMRPRQTSLRIWVVLTLPGCMQDVLVAQYPDEDSDPARGGAWGNFTKGSKTKAFAIKVHNNP